ncbi:MAG: hypothetical protein ABSC55_12975 [Syntrophorhabdales bacterium]|jgi:hypothetical protein
MFLLVMTLIEEGPQICAKPSICNPVPDNVGHEHERDELWMGPLIKNGRKELAGSNIFWLRADRHGEAKKEVLRDTCY